MLPRILIVDDESSICISLSLALEPEYEVVWETDPIRALERLQTEPIDLVLLDMVIGPYDGLDILMKIKKLAPLAAVIMMTAYGSIRSSVSAMTRGAFTYLTKPLDLEELKIYIRQALEFRSLNENVTYLNDQLEAQNQAEELIGTSPALEQVRTMLRKFQNVDVNVLITGESGTGKRIAAHTLQRMDGASSRSTARRSMKSGWKRSFSATKWTPFPALCATGAASSTMQTAARCIWTASAICRRSSSGSCCAFCRNTPSLPSAAARCTSSIRESSPRPTAPRTS